VFRLLGLLGGLAAVTDLGTGSAMDDSLRRCVVASRLARAAGCTDAEIGNAVYVALLQHIGCTAYSPDLAQAFGDDITATKLNFLMNPGDPREVFRTWLPGISAATGQSRVAVLARTVRSSRAAETTGPVATCEVATEAARRLGLPTHVRDGVHHALSRWNGKGYPRQSGDTIPLGTRIMHVASVAVLFLMHAGREAAASEVGRRAGTDLDPGLVEIFVANAAELLADVDVIDAYEAALDCEPDPVVLVDDAAVEDVARTFGDLVDLKSPWLAGHSSAVGELAAAATGKLGLDSDTSTVRIAGYLHDIGRVGVSSRIWNKSEPLSATERDQAHLHAYHGERVLARIPQLADVATLVGQHHERCDGTGYHRGITGDRMTMPARVLAAADEYQGMVEDRPQSVAVAAPEAAKGLRAQARAGRLDGDAVEGVLEAAGHRGHVRRSRPAGLTGRQIDVLRLLAGGSSNRDIADTLVISRRTAEHHVQDVYAKIGASTRAAAALFAMEHGLLDRH
jgi:HD-GYP domain-containing protein (c-di-GMP phosphodiesterase class II)